MFSAGSCLLILNFKFMTPLVARAKSTLGLLQEFLYLTLVPAATCSLLYTDLSYVIRQMGVELMLTAAARNLSCQLRNPDHAFVSSASSAIKDELIRRRNATTTANIKT